MPHLCNLFCNIQAVEGNGRSGVVVAQIIASIFDIADVKVRSKKFMIIKRKNENFFRLSHTLSSLLSIPRVILVFRGSKKSEMFYSSILSINKNPIQYKNIGPIKKFIKLYDNELIIITN